MHDLEKKAKGSYPTTAAEILAVIESERGGLEKVLAWSREGRIPQNEAVDAILESSNPSRNRKPFTDRVRALFHHQPEHQP
jgi:hypothetical protein